jgi:DNA-binding NarL/FixJ family response regulator
LDTPAGGIAMTTLLLVDDDPFNREAMNLFLRSKKLTVWEAADATTAWEIACAKQPDVAVIDIVMPAEPLEPVVFRKSLGVDLARQLKQTYPALGIVLFSAYEDRGADILSMLQQGIRGIAYKLKGCQPVALWQAVEAVQRGQVIIDPDVTNQQNLCPTFLALLGPEERPWVEMAAGLVQTLSSRELMVAEMAAAAHNTNSIADRLVITPKSVENHVNKIYGKLHIKDDDEVAGRQLRKTVVLAKALMLYQMQRND